MNLYVLRGDLDFHWLRPVDGMLWPWRSGAPIAQPWPEPSLTPDDDKRAFLPVDCFSMNTGSDGPILSEFARSVLQRALLPAGELWPVQVLGSRYWWFNCLACIDALDVARTDADWDEVEGEWGSFRWISTPRRLEFRPGVVAGAPALFRVPEFPQGILFGGEDLRDAISSFELTGFKLDPVWSEEAGGVESPTGFDFGEAFAKSRSSEVARKREAARAMLARRSAQGSEKR